MIGGFFEWANANGGVIALLALILTPVSALVGILIAQVQGVSIERQLRDTASRDHLIERFTDSGAEGYFNALQRILGFARWAYGPRALS